MPVSFSIKLQGSACNFIKTETLAQVLSCEFCKISKNNFFIEHLRATVSVTFEKVKVEIYFSIKLCTHAVRTKKKLNKKTIKNTMDSTFI